MESNKQKELYERYRETRAKYRSEHREERNAAERIRYQSNREAKLEKVRAYQKRNHVRVECECGGHYILTGKAEHLKTKKHQTYLSQQQC